MNYLSGYFLKAAKPLLDAKFHGPIETQTESILAKKKHAKKGTKSRIKKRKVVTWDKKDLESDSVVKEQQWKAQLLKNFSYIRQLLNVAKVKEDAYAVPNSVGEMIALEGAQLEKLVQKLHEFTAK